MPVPLLALVSLSNNQLFKTTWRTLWACSWVCCWAWRRTRRRMSPGSTFSASGRTCWSDSPPCPTAHRLDSVIHWLDGKMISKIYNLLRHNTTGICVPVFFLWVRLCYEYSFDMSRILILSDIQIIQKPSVLQNYSGRKIHLYTFTNSYIDYL